MKTNNFIYVQAFQNAKLLGWASYGQVRTEDHAVYHSQTAVTLEEQRIGFQKHLSLLIKNDECLLTDTKTSFFNTKYVSNKAINVYEKQGFVENSYLFKVHESIRDGGLEWKIQ